MKTAIRVERLVKTFPASVRGRAKVRALDGIDLEVRQGEILGILGPNGAGKTTLLNILSTLLLPDSGKIEICGIPSIPSNYNRLRSLYNMTSGYPNFPWSLTIKENLRFYGRLYGLSRQALTQRIQELIALFGLEEHADKKFEELSSGTKQRLSLAKALLNRPKVIFLDEPTVGLDPDVAGKSRQIILDIFHNSGVTVLLTTHNMQEAELLCQRIAFITQGRIIRLASPEELKKAQQKEDLEQVFIELARATPSLSRLDTPEKPKDKSPMIKEEWSDLITYSPNGFLNASRHWANRCLAFTYRNFLFAIRNFFALAELVFWPVVSLISIGLLGDYLRLNEKALAFVLTGAITAGIVQVTQLDVAYGLLYEVWSKSMKHTLLTPVGISENLVGSWLVGIMRGGVIFAVLGVAAVLLFGFPFPSATVTAVYLAGIFGCALLIGLLVNVLLLFFGQKAEITAWMFTYLFMLICGIYYPIDTLPDFFYRLAQYIPITYFLEYFRMSFGFEPVLSHSLWKGFGLMILYFWAGLGLMALAFHQARKKGVIVRLSE